MAVLSAGGEIPGKRLRFATGNTRKCGTWIAGLWKRGGRRLGFHDRAQHSAGKTRLDSVDWETSGIGMTIIDGVVCRSGAQYAARHARPENCE